MDTETPIEYFERLLKDPQTVAKGSQFVSDVEYALYLVKKHRSDEEALIEKINNQKS